MLNFEKKTGQLFVSIQRLGLMAIGANITLNGQICVKRDEKERKSTCAFSITMDWTNFRNSFGPPCANI
jgi:hypothetical protein